MGSLKIKAEKVSAGSKGHCPAPGLKSTRVSRESWVGCPCSSAGLSLTKGGQSGDFSSSPLCFSASHLRYGAGAGGREAPQPGSRPPAPAALEGSEGAAVKRSEGAARGPGVRNPICSPEEKSWKRQLGHKGQRGERWPVAVSLRRAAAAQASVGSCPHHRCPWPVRPSSG